MAEDERPPLEDALADDFPREPLEPLLADEDFERPDDLDFDRTPFDDFPEDLLTALALEDFRVELFERETRDVEDDFFLFFASKTDDRADFLRDDLSLLITSLEPPDRLEEPPDLKTFFDFREEDFDLTPDEFFLRDVLNGFRRLLSLAELLDLRTVFFFEFFTRALDSSDERYNFFFDPNPRTGASFVAARTEPFPDFLDSVFVEFFFKFLAEAVTRGLNFLSMRVSG